MPNQPISPAAILANRALDTPMLQVVTGERGAGKTNWCLELYQEARAVGIQPVGLVSLAVFQAGRKIGIDVMNLVTGERKRLAGLLTSFLPQPGLSEVPMQWDFYPDVLAWGNQILADLPPSEVLILDELGPLEFLSQAGWTAGLACIDEKRYCLSCVVIRPELLENALTRWPWAQVTWITAPALEDSQA